jgi:hypothetical protein
MRRPRPTTPRAPLPPVECHRRSRAALIGQVLLRVMHGERLVAIARHEHMPRVVTFRRWLRDAPLRARYDTALALQTQMLADDLVAAADREAASAPPRGRMAAAKRQIEARKLRVKMLKDEMHDDGDGEAKPGLTDGQIAILQAAWEEISPAPGGTAVTGKDSAPAERVDGPGTEGNADHAPSRDEETESDNEDAGEGTEASDPRDRGGTGVKDQPTPFVPRWFNDDDLRRPAPPYDPFEW